MQNNLRIDYDLDDADALIVISIGSSITLDSYRKGVTKTRIQLLSFYLKNIFDMEVEFNPYYFGPYSEAIQEKLNSTRHLMYYYSKNGLYVLGSKGKELYEVIKRDRPDIIAIAEGVAILNDKQLLGIVYNLFPEMFENAVNKEEAEQEAKKIRDVLAKCKVGEKA